MTIDGRLLEGRHRRAGHLGHISLDVQGAHPLHLRFEDEGDAGDEDDFSGVAAEVVADAGLAARREALEHAARSTVLPLGLDAAEPFRAPYRLALSNPVYLR